MVRMVEVRWSDVPGLTLAGVVWMRPVDGRRRRCEECALRALCAEAVAEGDFAGCERVMEWEIYEGEGCVTGKSFL